MAACGKTGRNRRTISALSLVIFLQLFASQCLSAPVNNTTPEKDVNTQGPETPQSLPALSTTINKEGPNSSTPKQSVAMSTGPENPTTSAGNDSTTTTEVKALKDNSTLTANQSKTSEENQETSQMSTFEESEKKQVSTNDSSQVTVPKEEKPVTPKAVPTVKPSVSATTTTSTQTSKSTTTSAKPPRPADVEELDSNMKTSNSVNQPTVQGTNPGPTANGPPINSYTDEADEDDEDDEDDGNYLESDDDDAVYESNNSLKEETVNRLQRPEGIVVTHYKETDSYNTEDQDSHFFFHLVILAFLVAIVYITYHNKRRIFLLAQSRRWKDGLCSRNTVEYHRLDQNVNEAMPSLKMTRDYIF
ncbi:keratinocyte-associated transmembrane protein 2 [Xyrichtys novacula]|uniref:Keratinocyte-associated transmembrane protein 2 n=1 Tax=Xyrichtys novacula TaxID=13765 RepID=A0AAV1FR81_XYRNO|nr:keratinocyte-associated transmembrane protein 2 [Xyrichtys novacula]